MGAATADGEFRLLDTLSSLVVDSETRVVYCNAEFSKVTAEPPRRHSTRKGSAAAWPAC
jgi:hypothetical protein